MLASPLCVEEPLLAAAIVSPRFVDTSDDVETRAITADA